MLPNVYYRTDTKVSGGMFGNKFLSYWRTCASSFEVLLKTGHLGIAADALCASGPSKAFILAS